MSNTVSKMISDAEKANVEAGGCALVQCAQLLSTLGLDVIPSADKWQYHSKWSNGTCGIEPTYYIVEIRYATADTTAHFSIRDNAGAVSIRVAGVKNNGANPKMSLFSEETTMPIELPHLYGVTHDAEEVPCVSK